ncbi:MAG: RNA polymerase sigma factor [Saprospiraceae bacterium]
MNLTDDNYLIKRILKGNERAQLALYEKYEQRWGRLCLRYGRNRTEAKDILQEGLMAVFKDLKQFDAKRASFNTWSNRVMVNAALRYLKKNHWQQSFEDLDVATNNLDISENALEQITAKELTALIQKLPSGYRVVFNMYAIEGYSHKEIAAELGITASASRSQLTKARKLLKKQLLVLF